MQPKIVVLILAYSSALMAFPMANHATERSITNDYEELYRRSASNGGSLVYYGHPSGYNEGRSQPATIQERDSCNKAPSPSCSQSHTARNEECDKLITALYDQGNIAVGKSPRQICYKGDAAKTDLCCVSWHKPINGLTKGDLADSANSIYSSCSTDGVSGKIANVNVHGTCSDVCLSNRGNGC